MEHFLSPVVLYNVNNNYFRQESLQIVEAWQHGAASADINNDGFWDIVTTGYGDSSRIYLGSDSGLNLVLESDVIPGSAIILGDFLGTGEMLAIVADGGDTSNADTVLRNFHIENEGSFIWSEVISVLPLPRLENSLTGDELSHDVRAIAFDFSLDGLSDVIIFSRAAWDGTKWPDLSEVQFLMNMGSGIFEDVTDDYLSGYNIVSESPYHPLTPKDFNLDGLLDLFVDGATFNTSTHQSASLLLQNKDQVFVDTIRNELSTSISASGGVSTLAMSDNGLLNQVILNQSNGKGIVSSRLVTFPERELSENLTDTHLDDRIWGLGGNDVIHLTTGIDIVDGGSGIDTVVYNNSRSVILKDSDFYSVEGDSLRNIERIQFSDANIALDLDASAGQTAKILGAVFGADAVTNKEYAGIGLHYLDGGWSYEQLMALAIDAALGANASHENIVNHLYTNVVGVAPTEAEAKPFVDMLVGGSYSKGSLGVLAAETPLNASNIDFVGLTENGLEYTPFG
jgi:hypothetical protein